MSIKTTLLLIIVILIVGIFLLHGYNNQNIPFGHTLVYQVSRYYLFNNIKINYQEFLSYSFSEVHNDIFYIYVIEPQQQYVVTVNDLNYSVINVQYLNSNVSLNANEGQIENIYLPFLTKMTLESLSLLSYTFHLNGTQKIYIPALGYTDSLIFVNKTVGTFKNSNYSLSITYYYSITTGLLVKSSYIWYSVGTTGLYYRNVTTVLVSID